MADQEGTRRLLGGSTNVGLVVFTALSALAITLVDTTELEESEAMMEAALKWADTWVAAEDDVKEVWARNYEHLMDAAGTIADAGGEGGES